MRGPVFDLLGSFAPIVVVVGEGGMRFAVRTDDREIGRHTFVNGAYDLETMRCALQLLQTEGGRTLQGRTVLDVGANIGVSIIPLMRLFGAGHGIAFEPAPDAVEMLELNVALNDLGERVHVMALGLSDRDGALELALSADNFGDHRIRASDANASDDTSGRQTVTVQVRRLDGLVQSGEVDGAAVGLVWLDVQGHEGHVLAGARDLLASGVPVVTEFWPSAMRRAGGLEAFHDVVRSCFARVFDVRAAQEEGRPEAVPGAHIEDLTERYAEPAAFTDLLLLP
jgi:FkbM family methyltransferase